MIKGDDLKEMALSSITFLKENSAILFLLIPLALIALAYWMGFRSGKKKENDIEKKIDDEIIKFKKRNKHLF